MVVMIERSSILKMFSTTFNQTTKLWTGHDIQPLYNPKISLAQVLFNAMSKFGPKTAQVSSKNLNLIVYFPQKYMFNIRFSLDKR